MPMAYIINIIVQVIYIHTFNMILDMIRAVSGLGDLQQDDQGVLPDSRSLCAFQGGKTGTPLDPFGPWEFSEMQTES